jgi:hypothetical protein
MLYFSSKSIFENLWSLQSFFPIFFKKMQFLTFLFFFCIFFRINTFIKMLKVFAKFFCKKGPFFSIFITFFIFNVIFFLKKHFSEAPRSLQSFCNLKNFAKTLVEKLFPVLDYFNLFFLIKYEIPPSRHFFAYFGIFAYAKLIRRH